MKRKSKYPLTRLSEQMDLTLYLIKQELKSAKFFNVLQNAGIDDVYYQIDLASPIIRLMGVRDCSDKLLEAYFNIIDSASEKVKPEVDSLTKQSLKVYNKLKKEIKSTRKATDHA